MSNSINVQSWRKRTKERLVTAFNSKCGVCSYSKCIQALQFHHLDPEHKDFGLANVIANIKSWDTIISEARKCIMVCGNCHSEIHAGITPIPDNVPRFNEEFAIYRKTDFGEQNNCPICQTLKPSSQSTCSRSCAAKTKPPKIDWDSLNLAELIKGRSILSIAKELGVSDAAVNKRLKKLGLK
jgi:hypothetical protein